MLNNNIIVFYQTFTSNNTQVDERSLLMVDYL